MRLLMIMSIILKNWERGTGREGGDTDLLRMEEVAP